MKQTILTIAVTALCIVACTSEDPISQDPLADTPIKLNVSVTNPTTRAGYSNDLLPDTFRLWVHHDDNNYDKYLENIRPFRISTKQNQKRSYYALGKHVGQCNRKCLCEQYSGR